MSELEQTCLSLKGDERCRLAIALIKSIECDVPEKTFERMHKAIVKVVGCEVLIKNNRRIYVTGRTILAFACFMQGMSEWTISKYLGRNHSSVNRMKQNMTDWLSMPNIFGEENKLYVQFLNELSNETD